MDLLTDKEKQNISQWCYSVDDPSITTKLLNPFWNVVASYVPEYVAPNLLSLAGLLLTVYAFHITYLYSNIYPRLVSLVSAILLFSYQTIDAIDGKHARNIKNASPLGELFDHACDSVGTIFIILTITTTLGITIPSVLFYITQAGLMLFLIEHLKAHRTKKVTFLKYTGPGEIILGCIGILIWKFVTGYSVIPSAIINHKIFTFASFMVYWVVYIYSLIFTFLNLDIDDFKNIYRLDDLGKNYNGLSGTSMSVLLCLFMRHINGILLWYGLIADWSLQDVIAHGLVLSVVISDLIVAKMANRELHPIIVIGSMLSVFNHNLLIFILVCIYYIKVFHEICNAMGLLLFTPSKNVYICGVWDLLHLGHMKHFKEVSKYGNRLLVGIHTDKDVLSYKRTPVLTMEERATTALHCKCVSEVIKGAPLIMDLDFINRHNIHVVCCSEEYDIPEDEYYGVPRSLGILRVMERTSNISTTALMNRIKTE